MKPIDRYGSNNLCNAKRDDRNDRKITLNKFLGGPKSVIWKESMKEELDLLHVSAIN